MLEYPFEATLHRGWRAALGPQEAEVGGGPTAVEAVRDFRVLVRAGVNFAFLAPGCPPVFAFLPLDGRGRSGGGTSRPNISGGSVTRFTTGSGGT